MSLNRRKHTLSQGLGNLRSYAKTPQGLTFQTEGETGEVIVYGAAVLRIRIRRKDDISVNHSYAVIAVPEKTAFSVREDKSALYLATAQLQLVISKKPLRFSLYNKEGELINADDTSFGTRWQGTEVTTYKALQPGERFIGLGEKTGNLDRRGTAYTNWNTDKFSYAVDADPIYMSIPFYIGIHGNQAYGIFFDNTFKTKFNFGASNNRFASFSAEDGEMNYYLIGGDGVRSIIQNYTWLTGRMELPPLWSLGLQQCRYSYYPDTEVLNLARTFREKKIPADVIYLDIHYMDEYKVFTFHPQRFPSPAKMVKELKEQDFHTIVILDPGIKVEKGYAPYDEGVKNNYFAQYPDGENYSGEVWPGWSHFPDFTNPGVRKWWAEKMKFYTTKGIDGFWNDMNEPAAWGQTVPDLVEFDYEGNHTTHKQAHNIYGMQMARSTFTGAQQNLKGARPFVLNRSGYSGVQRFAATWTGDNVASDEHMLCGVRLVNSLGLSGVPFAGYDVGGFAGDPSPALFARWIVLGAFSPLFRCHSMINSKDAEPWAFGEEVEEISRNYIGLRYRLLPYIYATFYESSQTGTPVARSLALDYAFDEKIYEHRYQNQYFFGDAFLIPPVESGKEFLKCYLPENDWYDLHTGNAIPAGEQIVELRNERYPVFVKGSSIVPMQSLVQSTAESPKEVLEIHLYKGRHNNSFLYYEDDGATYKYQKGQFYSRHITYHAGANKLVLAKPQGKFKTKFTQIKLHFHGFGDMGVVKIQQEPTILFNEDYVFIKPVSHFDPFYKPNTDDMANYNLPFILFENLPHEISISW